MRSQLTLLALFAGLFWAACSPSDSDLEATVISLEQRAADYEAFSEYLICVIDGRWQVFSEEINASVAWDNYLEGSSTRSEAEQAEADALMANQRQEAAEDDCYRAYQQNSPLLPTPLPDDAVSESGLGGLASPPITPTW